MQGIQGSVAEDLFASIKASNQLIRIFVSYFEIYGGRCQDLLNSRQRLNVREDGGGEVSLRLAYMGIHSLDKLHINSHPCH